MSTKFEIAFFGPKIDIMVGWICHIVHLKVPFPRKIFCLCFFVFNGSKLRSTMKSYVKCKAKVIFLFTEVITFEIKFVIAFWRNLEDLSSWKVKSKMVRIFWYDMYSVSVKSLLLANTPENERVSRSHPELKEKFDLYNDYVSEYFKSHIISWKDCKDCLDIVWTAIFWLF